MNKSKDTSVGAFRKIESETAEKQKYLTTLRKDNRSEVWVEIADAIDSLSGKNPQQQFDESTEFQKLIKDLQVPYEQRTDDFPLHWGFLSSRETEDILEYLELQLPDTTIPNWIQKYVPSFNLHRQNSLMPLKTDHPLVEEGQKYLGYHEKHQQEKLQEFFKKNDIKCDPAKDGWCAYYVYNILENAGYKTPKIKYDWQIPLRRTYNKYGKKSKGDIGDLALWKGIPGHIGIVAQKDLDGSVWILGGNQDNKVSLNRYTKKELESYLKPNYIKPPKTNKAIEPTKEDSLKDLFK